MLPYQGRFTLSVMGPIERYLRSKACRFLQIEDILRLISEPNYDAALAALK